MGILCFLLLSGSSSRFSFSHKLIKLTNYNFMLQKQNTFPFTSIKKAEFSQICMFIRSIFPIRIIVFADPQISLNFQVQYYLDSSVQCELLRFSSHPHDFGDSRTVPTF